MSADNFLHQVELAMQQYLKVYDFRDFVNVVAKANKKVNFLTPHDFFEWEDCSSIYKLKKLQPWIYQKDIVQIRSKRGAKNLTYKTSFSGDELELNFLKNKNVKYGIRFPLNKKPIRRITEERNNNIIKKLSSIIPEHYIQF
ncbi:hypothetical protein JTB14_030345 [Gonioctena quinquepunctata]|nr:hypothetical protein JTB14_030345 [Gonioctena quinquepunctata]